MVKVYFKDDSMLAFLNFLAIMLLSVIYFDYCNCMMDFISIIIGSVLIIGFLIILSQTHDDINKNPKNLEFSKKGIYKHVRHPYYLGIIFLNIAYYLFFRSAILIPVISIFIGLFYLQAKNKEKVLTKKFGKKYSKYKKNVGMFFPKLN